MNPNEHAGVMKVLKIFIIFLIIFVGIKSIGALKGFRYIGVPSQSTVNTITVSGTGEVSAVPDIATESVTISEEGKTQKEAGDKMAVQEKKVLDFLKSSGIADKDIKTTSNSVNPKYDYLTRVDTTVCAGGYCPPGKQVISGYEATESIDVKIRNADDVGKIVQGLTDIGVQLYGPNFTIDNEDALNQEARQKAIQDAKKKAGALEHDLGIHLGRIVNFSENGGGYPMMYSAKAEMAPMDSGAPAPTISKGENKITSNITITYEIR